VRSIRLCSAQGFQGSPAFLLSAKSFITEVNHQIAHVSIRITGKNKEADISDLGPEDVIVPAFGTERSIQQQIKDRGCQIVIPLRRRDERQSARKYASESLLHLHRAEHEEIRPQARAPGDGAAITRWS
jgi:hypothetical protein